MAYSITINSSAAARALAAEKGYNVVFAKGVKATRPADEFPFNRDFVEFNTAWFVLNPNDMGDSFTVSWDAAPYSGTYQDDLREDGAKIEVDRNIVNNLKAGVAVYHVDETGTMRLDPKATTSNMRHNNLYCDRPEFQFINYFHRAINGDGYYPVLLTQDPAGNKVPFWSANSVCTGTAVRMP
jgi:hypothetical protein